MENKLKKLIVAVVGLMLITPVAYARSKPLVDPPKVMASCKLNDKQMLQGISAGLAARGWLITNKKPGKLVAQVIVRNKHTLVVSIQYTDDSYDIDYLNSDNLNYKTKDGVAYIHPNANSWMDNINQDIRSQLSILCSMK